MMKTLIAVAVTVGIAVVFSCRPSNVDNSSNLQHVVGKTRVDPSTPLKPCVRPEEQKNAYLDKILDHITSKNPETFSGPYARENLCIGLNPSLAINAFADPSSGSLFLLGGLVMKSDHDSEIAAVVSHELAHITMQSGSMSIENSYPELLTHADYKAGAEAVVAAQKAFDTAGSAMMTDAGPLMILVAQLSDKETDEQRKKLADLDAQGKAELETYKTELNPLMDEMVQILMDPDTAPEQKQEKWDDLMLRLQALMRKFEARTIANWDAKMDVMAEIAAAQGQAVAWADARTLYTNTRNAFYAARGRQEQSKVELETLTEKYMGHGALRNWMEQEADEVGFELYLRAGFDPSWFVSMYWSFLDQNKNTSAVKQCRDLFQKLAQGETVDSPLRGILSHPSDCWRIFDISQNELRAHHAQEYERILQDFAAAGQKPIVDLFGSDLQNLKEQLKIQTQPKPTAAPTVLATPVPNPTPAPALTPVPTPTVIVAPPSP